jgi:anti-sigma regulatory factor (Ser/Thr protein kinase)
MAERIFLAKADNIPEITAFVREHAELAGLSAKKLMQLELVVEEAVINICNYAYEVPPGDVTIRVNGDAKRFVMEFDDSGIPFDPLILAEPDLKLGLNEREAGGLGIFLVRRMTDEVHYRRVDGRNILTVAINIL